MDIFAAIENCNELLALKLIDENNNFSHHYDERTLLTYACEKQMESVVLKLLDKVENIYDMDECGDNVFIMACGYGLKKIFDILIKDKNININGYNNAGETALILACIEGPFVPKYEDIAIMLIDHGADLYFSCSSHSKNAVEIMYQDKATKVLEHLQYIIRKSLYESTNEYKTIMSKSFTNPIADLNIFDIIATYCF